MASLGQRGTDIIDTGGTYHDGVNTLAIGGAYRERDGLRFGSLVGSLRKTLPLVKEISDTGAVHEEAQNASFARQFSLQRIAALYHCLGASSDGLPEVRQAIWS